MNIKKDKLPLEYGFTLIELMVVISIIALLSSILLANLNPPKAYARDAAREETMHSISTALELYNDTNGHYPIHTAAEDISVQGMADYDLLPYIQPLPSSFGVGNDTDYYVSDLAGSSYEILAAKETTSGSGGGLGAITSTGCNSTDYSNYASTVGNNAFCNGSGNVSSPLWTPDSSTAPTVYLSVADFNPIDDGYVQRNPYVYQGDYIKLIWNTKNAQSCNFSDATQMFSSHNGWLGTGGYYVAQVNTVANGGNDISGAITMTCYSGNMTGTTGSATSNVTVVNYAQATSTTPPSQDLD